MNARTAAVTVSLLVLAAFLGALMMALLEHALADDGPIKPPVGTIAGYVVLQQCTISGQPAKIAAPFALVDPAQIALITHTPDSPEGCVKITTPAGRSIFAKGSESSIAALRQRAQLGR